MNIFNDAIVMCVLADMVILYSQTYALFRNVMR
jgi:hypothetical protein